MPILTIKQLLEKSPEELSTYNELKISGDYGCVIIDRLKLLIITLMDPPIIT